MRSIQVPQNYDYVGVYLTNTSHLPHANCTTIHHETIYDSQQSNQLTASEWIKGLNRLQLPTGVPLTLQGTEPFLYNSIWQILENVHHKIDILTTLPSFLTKEHFLNLKTLQWNIRKAPCSTIRVSYHRGQHDYRQLIRRIAELQEVVSIGLYYKDHQVCEHEHYIKLKECADDFGVMLRKQEFLGRCNGRIYGNFLYKDAAEGKLKGTEILYKNTALPIGPDGNIYRCHADLHLNRINMALGNILDENFEFPDSNLYDENYSECGVKVQANHNQICDYSLVDIKPLDKGTFCELERTEC